MGSAAHGTQERSRVRAGINHERAKMDEKAKTRTRTAQAFFPGEMACGFDRVSQGRHPMDTKAIAERMMRGASPGTEVTYAGTHEKAPY